MLGLTLTLKPINEQEMTNTCYANRLSGFVFPETVYMSTYFVLEKQIVICLFIIGNSPPLVDNVQN